MSVERKEFKVCNYCSRHNGTKQNSSGFYNEITLAQEPYTLLSMGVDESDDIVLIAYGDYEAVYKPKFCPECGADLRYRKAKVQLSSLYGECVTDE